MKYRNLLKIVLISIVILFILIPQAKAEISPTEIKASGESYPGAELRIIAIIIYTLVCFFIMILINKSKKEKKIKRMRIFVCVTLAISLLMLVYCFRFPNSSASDAESNHFTSLFSDHLWVMGNSGIFLFVLAFIRYFFNRLKIEHQNISKEEKSKEIKVEKQFFWGYACFAMGSILIETLNSWTKMF